jgi:hypothetical protein
MRIFVLLLALLLPAATNAQSRGGGPSAGPAGRDQIDNRAGRRTDGPRDNRAGNLARQHWLAPYFEYHALDPMWDIDTPVIGYGNEALWEDFEPAPVIHRSTAMAARQ